MANYGDAGTDWEHTTDTFLVNRGSGYAHNPELMPGVLETLYRHGYQEYGWFLSLRPEQITLNDLLYGKLESLDAATPPPAPSRVFPQAGTAMLWSDESADYWTSGAIAVQALGATGLRRQGTFHINLHARGRLIYPWQNTQQYEVFSDPHSGMNWAWSELNKNTVVVDGKVSGKGGTHQRHAFHPEVKFYSMSGSGNRYEGVDQDRILMLTDDYLLDLFALSSGSPHVYDYALKAYGLLHHDNRSLYEPTGELTHFDGLGYKWVENQLRRETQQDFHVDWVQNTAGWRRDYQHGWGSGLGDPWWQTEVGVRMRMLGEPGTTVFTGQVPLIGYTLRSHRSRTRPVPERPEEVFEIMIARRTARETLYAALHEPYQLSGGERPAIAGFEYIYRPAELEAATSSSPAEETKAPPAAGVKITSTAFVDRAFCTLAIGQDAQAAEVTVTSELDPDERIAFSNYAYIRAAEGRLTARGEITSFAVYAPEVPESGGLIVNGKPAQYRKHAGYVVYGQVDVPQRAQPLVVERLALQHEVIHPGEPIRAEVQLRNTSDRELSEVTVALFAGADSAVRTSPVEIGTLAAGSSQVAQLVLDSGEVFQVGSVHPLTARAAAASAGGEPLTANASTRVSVDAPARLTLPLPYTNISPQSGVLQIRVDSLADDGPVRGVISVQCGEGLIAGSGQLGYGPLSAGQHANLQLTLVPQATATGQTIPVTLTHHGETDAGRRYLIEQQTVEVAVGVVMQETRRYFDYFLVRTPHYTTLIDKYSGLSRCLIDADGVERTGLDVYPYRHARFHPADLFGFINWYAVPGVTRGGAERLYRELTNYASQELDKHLVFRFAHEAAQRTSGTDPETGYPVAEFASPDGQHRLRYTFHPEFIRLSLEGAAADYSVDFYHVARSNPNRPFFTRVEGQDRREDDLAKIRGGSYVEYGFGTR